MPDFDVASHAAFIREAWQRVVLFARESPRLVTKRVLRVEQTVAAYGDLFHFPNVANISASAVAADGTVTTTQNTETDTTIAVDQWRGTSVDIPDNVMQQAGAYDLADIYGPKLGYGVAVDIEDQVFDLDNQAGVTTTGGGTQGVDGSSLHDEEITAALAVQDANEVPVEDRSFFFHPNVVRDLRRVEKFVSALHIGENPGPIATGVIGSRSRVPSMKSHFAGSVYGVPIWWTNRVNAGTSGRQNHLIQAESYGLVLQRDTRVKELPVTRLARVFAADAMFGLGVLRGDHTVILLS